VHRDAPTAGRHAVPVGFRPLRLVVLFLCTVLASASVAASMMFVMPDEQPATMADPLFDPVAFYRAHFPERFGDGRGGLDRAARGAGTAFVRGEPVRPGPVAGLTQAQTDNAYIIVEVGKVMQLPKRAYVVAIATALQESNLRNLANSTVPASLKLPHDGTDTNLDSIGLFQQRASMGWGTVAQLMDPAQSAARFYSRLIRVGGWQTMTITQAAQAVQRSAFPGAYAKHGDRAQDIVDALT
jgi:hypothetical protein